MSKTITECKKQYPGYAVYAKVFGGFQIFYTVVEYNTWRSQK